jgi:hypothetical protein
MGARARRAGLDPDGSFRACVVRRHRRPLPAGRRRRPLRRLRFNPQILLDHHPPAEVARRSCTKLAEVALNLKL